MRVNIDEIKEAGLDRSWDVTQAQLDEMRRERKALVDDIVKNVPDDKRAIEQLKGLFRLNELKVVDYKNQETDLKKLETHIGEITGQGKGSLKEGVLPKEVLDWLDTVSGYAESGQLVAVEGPHSRQHLQWQQGTL